MTNFRLLSVPSEIVPLVGMDGRVLRFENGNPVGIGTQFEVIDGGISFVYEIHKEYYREDRIIVRHMTGDYKGMYVSDSPLSFDLHWA